MSAAALPHTPLRKLMHGPRPQTQPGHQLSGTCVVVAVLVGDVVAVNVAVEVWVLDAVVVAVVDVVSVDVSVLVTDVVGVVSWHSRLGDPRKVEVRKTPVHMCASMHTPLSKAHPRLHWLQSSGWRSPSSPRTSPHALHAESH